MKDSSKYFSHAGSEAIGLKLVGVGFCSAAAFPIGFTDALFHMAGTTDPARPARIEQVMQGHKQCRALLEEDVWTNEHGADVDLVFLTAAAISSIVMVSQSKSTDGVGGDGIQG